MAPSEMRDPIRPPPITIVSEAPSFVDNVRLLQCDVDGVNPLADIAKFARMRSDEIEKRNFMTKLRWNVAGGIGRL